MRATINYIIRRIINFFLRSIFKRNTRRTSNTNRRSTTSRRTTNTNNRQRRSRY